MLDICIAVCNIKNACFWPLAGQPRSAVGHRRIFLHCSGQPPRPNFRATGRHNCVRGQTSVAGTRRDSLLYSTVHVGNTGRACNVIHFYQIHTHVRVQTVTYKLKMPCLSHHTTLPQYTVRMCSVAVRQWRHSSDLHPHLKGRLWPRRPVMRRIKFLVNDHECPRPRRNERRISQRCKGI